MRLLVRPRPRIEEPVGVELAEEFGRPVLRPRLQDDVDQFLVPLARRRRIDRIGPVLHAGAERERDLEASVRHHVEHGVFLGQAVGIFEVRRRAPHADLGVAGLRNERGGDQVRRRHHAVGGVVMLVDDDGVEAELVGEHELGQIALVERMAALGIIIFVREIHPQRLELLVVLGEMHVGKKMHEIEANIAAHRYLPFRFTHEAGPGGPAASPAFGECHAARFASPSKQPCPPQAVLFLQFFAVEFMRPQLAVKSDSAFC